MSRKRTSDAELIRMYESGMSTLAIAEAVGASSRKVIAKRLNKAGIYLLAERKIRPEENETDENEAAENLRIVEMYNDGSSLSEIAQAIDSDEKAVRARLVKLGVLTPLHKKKPVDLSSLRAMYPETFGDVPWRPRWTYENPAGEAELMERFSKRPSDAD